MTLPEGGEEPVVIREGGDEAGDPRVEPPGAVEEDAPLGGHRLGPVEDMLQRRDAAAVGVDRLGGLGQLLRVAEEDQSARGPVRVRAQVWRHRIAHGHGIGQGELPGLVDDEHVDAAGHLGPGPQPGRATDETRGP